MASKAQTPEQPKTQGFVYTALILGWLIPGAGHLLTRHWIRALLLFVTITAMFSLGLAMQAKVYVPNTGDPLDILGFAGDLGGNTLLLRTHLFARPEHGAAGHGGLRHQVCRGGRPAEFRSSGGRAQPSHRKEGLGADAFPFHRSPALRHVHVGRVWHHAAVHDPRDDSLRDLLLGSVCCVGDSRQLADVACPAVIEPGQLRISCTCYFTATAVLIAYSDPRAPMNNVRLSFPPKARLPGRSGTSRMPAAWPSRS